MADLVAELDALAPQLAALVSILPAERSADEAEAVEAMGLCLHKLRGMAPELAASHQRFLAAHAEREQHHLALRRLLHDIRSPTSVLYSYLQLIGCSMIFAHASTEARAQAELLVVALRRVRDECLQTPPLDGTPYTNA
ncbi:MAG: hypothetical protein H7Y32_02940 [Chloroflexales bacterium]|nr:hypothetical protein [Chloroflexales bacterium]